jgi:hypothetical protein
MLLKIIAFKKQYMLLVLCLYFINYKHCHQRQRPQKYRHRTRLCQSFGVGWRCKNSWSAFVLLDRTNESKVTPCKGLDSHLERAYFHGGEKGDEALRFNAGITTCVCSLLTYYTRR